MILLPKRAVVKSANTLGLCSRNTILFGYPPRETSAPRKESGKVNMTFVEDDGTEIKVEAEVGATLLEVAHENDIELEGATCCVYTLQVLWLPPTFDYGCRGMHSWCDVPLLVGSPC